MLVGAKFFVGPTGTRLFREMKTITNDDNLFRTQFAKSTIKENILNDEI